MERSKWFTSKEAKEYSKLRSCDLMHYRMAGKLKFIKQGNAFLYSQESLDNIKKE